jgi:very-short-patch-repair endonuclease
LSISKKKQWENYTDEQKYDIITRLNEIRKPQVCKINKIETKISNALMEVGLPFQFSYFIKRRQFDFKIANNIIIEVQGDYWHANPKFYKEDDIINYPGGKCKAKDVWSKDAVKKEIAERYGYEVFYVWEDEIKHLNEKDIVLLIKEKIETKLHHLHSN